VVWRPRPLARPHVSSPRLPGPETCGQAPRRNPITVRRRRACGWEGRTATAGCSRPAWRTRS
jgi:hypothetical protein